MSLAFDDPGEPGVLVIGEALVDVVISRDGTRDTYPGGSPMNVAVGLARLGISTSLATMIGIDPEGAQISQHLKQSGVKLCAGSFTETPTSSAVATLGASGAAQYDFKVQWDLPVPEAHGFRLIHTGSIGSLLEPGASVVRRMYERVASSILLSFDPNIRPEIMGPREKVVPRVEALARYAHIVKMSDEDAQWLYPARTHREIAEKYSAMGVALFVVTRGSDGCYLRTEDHELEFAAPSVAVSDTIGAGDAFMSGLLHAVLTTDLADQVLKHTVERSLLECAGGSALASAAHTVTQSGANPPDQNQLGKALQSWFRQRPSDP